MKMIQSIFLCFLLVLPSSASGDLLHEYKRGETGDVILEGYHALVKEWEPLVLFFGFVEDMDDCEEVADIWNQNHAPTHIFRCTRIE